MLYDVFDGAATQLSGIHLEPARRAGDAGGRRARRARRRAVEEQRHAVDPDDRDALVRPTRSWLAEIEAVREEPPRTAPPRSHDVSRTLLERVFAHPDDGGREFVFRGRTPSPDPVLVLLGAQPGAGTSRVQALLARRRPDLVPPAGDRLRSFHPHHTTLMRQAPLTMPDATARAGGARVRMCLDHALDQRHSLLPAGSFRDSRTPPATAQRFAGAGYRVEVVALGVREEVSRLDAVNRSLSPGPVAGRWTPPDAHDLSYRTAPQTVAACEASPHVHRITVVDRSGRAHFDTERGPDGTWTGPSGAADVLLRLRNRPLSPQEARLWPARRDDHVTALLRRGAPSPAVLGLLEKLYADSERVSAYAYSGFWDLRSRRLNARRQRLFRRALDAAARTTR